MVGKIEKARILFMGTPDFAVPSLERLFEDGHDICGVVAQPDKPKGRGMIMQAPPVKAKALSLGIPVFQPERLRGGEFSETLEKLSPDLIIVVAYGKILPDYILDYPRYGSINLHGSLLPEYRGAAPIQRSVMDGKKTVGATTMYMASELDAGDIILKFETELGEYETAGELHDRLSISGAQLLSETVRRVLDGDAPRTAQERELVTFAPMLRKEEGDLDWSASPEVIVNMVRGLNPWPSAYSSLDGQMIKIHRAIKTDGVTAPDVPDGTVVGFTEGVGIIVSCGGGKTVAVTELQAAGGRKMSAADYHRGHSDIDGKHFGRRGE